MAASACAPAWRTLALPGKSVVVGRAALLGLVVEPRYLELARAALGPVQEMLARYPLGFAQWLIAQDYVLLHPRVVSIVGDVEGADTQALLNACATGHRPPQVVALGAPGTVQVPRHRDQVNGRATADVCVGF